MTRPGRRVPAENIDRRILDAVDEGVLVQDAESRIVVVNRAAARMLEADVAAVIGRTTTELRWRFTDTEGRPVPPDERPAQVAAASGEPVRCKLLYAESPDGRQAWLEISSYPLHGADDTVDAVITTLRDVTDRRATEARIRFQADLLDRVGQAVVATDIDGIVVYANRSAETVYGWGVDDAVGRRSAELLGDERLARDVSRAIVRGQTWTGDVIARRRDGTEVPVYLTVSPLSGNDGRPTGSVAVAADMTERLELERALAEDRQRLVEAQRAARLGSWEYDLRTGATTWSAELARIVGIPPNTEASVRLYVDSVHPDDRVDVLAAWQRIIDGGTELDTTHRILWPDGEVRWVEARAWLAEPHLVRGTLLDVTDRIRAQEALAHQSLHDPLTGLSNRVLLDDRLQQAIVRAERAGGHVGVLFVDLDRFKLVNDAIGHAAGDALLIDVARRLREALHPSDTVARFAGDEFVVVRDDLAAPRDIEVVAERVLTALDEPFFVDDQELFVSASVGAAVSTTGLGAASLLRAADAAMFRAKARGRGRVELFDERLRQHAAARLSLGSELRRALDRDELRVVYQPIVQVEDGRPVGVEALLRWERPDGASVPPGEFVPVAEDNGLIVPIGRWVLGRALRDLARMRSAHPGLRGLFVSVNLSARQLLSGELLDAIVEDLAATGLEPSALHMEITETVLMDDVEHSIESLAALRSLGVVLAVDDFGTGYSSLSYLKRLPLDTLKIDRSFVHGIEEDGDGSAIVDAVTSLGRALGLTILAEGVEDESQRRRLVSIGCQLAQGYLWSRPVPVEDVEAWLARAADALV